VLRWRRGCSNVGSRLSLVPFADSQVEELARKAAVAFVCEAQTLTAGELERDANRRAREFARAA